MRDLWGVILLPHVLLEFLHCEEIPCVLFALGRLFVWVMFVAIIFVLTMVLSEGKPFPEVNLTEGSFTQLAESAVLVLKRGVNFLGAGHMSFFEFEL